MPTLIGAASLAPSQLTTGARPATSHCSGGRGNVFISAVMKNLPPFRNPATPARTTRREFLGTSSRIAATHRLARRPSRSPQRACRRQ